MSSPSITKEDERRAPSRGTTASSTKPRSPRIKVHSIKKHITRENSFPRSELWSFKKPCEFAPEEDAILSGMASASPQLPVLRLKRKTTNVRRRTVTTRRDQKNEAMNAARIRWENVARSRRKIIRLAPKAPSSGSTTATIESIVETAQDEESLIQSFKIMMEEQENSAIEIERQHQERQEDAEIQYRSGEARPNFFHLCHESRNAKERPETSRRKYIDQCEKTNLLPLPVLDFASGNRVHRYDDANGKLNFQNYYFGDGRAKALAEALEVMPFDFRQVSLENTGLSSSGSIAIVNKLAGKELRELALNFSLNHIGKHGCENLSQVLKKHDNFHLVELNLARNGLGDFAIEQLLATLKKKNQIKHLNLQANKLYSSGRILSEMIASPDSKLQTLDLSWNQFRNEIALALAKSLADNQTLQALDLSDNSFGNSNFKTTGEFTEPDIALALSLYSNSTLESLGLCNNQIKARTVFILLDALRTNTSLKLLALNGNPIGQLGGALIFSAIAREKIQCVIDVASCNFEIEDSDLFLAKECAGTHVLHLSQPYDYVIAKELYELQTEERVTIQTATYSSTTSNSGESWTSPPVEIPSVGTLTLQVALNEDTGHCAAISTHGFDLIITALQRSFEVDDYRKAIVVQQFVRDFGFTSAQANSLLELFSSSSNRSDRAEVAAALLLQISYTPEKCNDDSGSLNPTTFFEDADGDGQIDACGDICILHGLTGLNDFEQSFIEQKLHKWVSFNVANPTGAYHLNLSSYVERLIMVRVLDAANLDHQYRTINKLPDISQQGKQHANFRNVTLNRQPYRVLDSVEWKLPRQGIIKFDFVVTRRPHVYCTPLNDNAFETFFREFKQLQVPTPTKLIGLRSMSSKFYFTSRQVSRLMEHFGPFEKDKHGYLYRVQVFIILFGRIVDEVNFDCALDILDRQSRPKLLDSLGYATLFNPIKPTGPYELNLEIYDHRFVFSTLIRIDRSGEGKLTDIFHNDCGLDLPSQWADDNHLPKRGIIRCKFAVANKATSIQQLPADSCRRKLAKQFMFKETPKSSHHRHEKKNPTS